MYRRIPFRSTFIFLVLGTAALFGGCTRETHAPLPVGVIDDLMAGHSRFLQNETNNKADLRSLVRSTADQQNPKAVVITCSDSRLVPEIIFDQSIGDLFVIRNAGNIVDGELELGSLQFAVEHLGVRTVIVMGHERCGAITALMNNENGATGHLAKVLGHLAEETEEQEILTHRAEHPDAIHDGVLANIIHGMRSLHAMDLIRSNQVEVFGFSYDQTQGTLHSVDLPAAQADR